MKKYKKYKPNENGKDYVCSDIHGCFSDLEEILESINFDTSVDRLFCVGDMVDRGPESERCLEFLAKRWFFSAYGNHEDLVVSGDTYLHAMNGGSWFYSLSETEQDEIVTQFRELPLVIQVGDYGIVHAELPTDINDWDELVEACEHDHSTQQSLIWGRHRIRYGVDTKINNIKKVYVGHTVVPKPKTQGNTIYIDTGGFLKHYPMDDGHITIVELKHGS